MAIQGSVLITSNGGANTVTLPSSDLTIVGIFHNDIYVSIQMSPGQFAYIPHFGTGFRRYAPVTFKPGTNSFTISSPTSGAYIVIYYGTPVANAKPLSDYIGVLASASPSAAGSGSVNVNFPKGSGKLTGYSCYVTTSYVETQFNTATGKQLTFFDVTEEVLEIQNITPLDVSLADTFTLNYTAGAALSFYAFFFYK